MNDVFPGLTFGKATRDAYGEELRELGREHKDIVVLDADLSQSTRSAFFAEEYPDRFLNVGIQEANLVGIAGGLASCGKVPFVSSFACFVILKAFDQLRMAVAYPRLNVKVVGSHGGISAGEDGASQQAVEDLGLACSLPGFVVCAPCDEHQARAAVRAAHAHDGPVYLRTGRARAPLIYGAADVVGFAFGQARRLRDGGDVAIVACGMMVGAAIKAHEILGREGIAARVIDMPTLKPLDEAELIAAAAETDAIVTAEEHLIHGGLGARVAQVVGRHHPVRLAFVGLEDCYAESGPAGALFQKYGLTAERIADAARALVRRRA